MDGLDRGGETRIWIVLRGDQPTSIHVERRRFFTPKDWMSLSPGNNPYNRVLSRLRYWMASEMCGAVMASTSSRSAMVRAIFRMRV